jgi:type VI secretion system secreted protein VgrG
MSRNESQQGGMTEMVVLDGNSVYESLCSKINLKPVSVARPLEAFRDNDLLSESSADERLARGMSAFLQLVGEASKPVDRLDKSLLDFHIGQLDRTIGRQLDAVMYTPEFQALEGRWRGLRMLVSRTDFRKNARIEVLDVSKDALIRDFEDTPELIQSGLYRLAYIEEYDTPGGQPIGALISDFEFANSPQDIGLLRNISKVAAAAHMPFIGSVGPAFFGKQSMEEVAAIQDIGNYFDRAEYIKWKSFRDTDDARYVGLTMPRVLGRLPYGKHTTPVRAFNYEEAVKGPDHDRYLWVNASFAFAANMVRSFTGNGWCVQIRGPQAGGSRLYRYDIEFTSAVADIPMDQVLGRPAKFVIDPIDPNADYLVKMFGENASKFSEMPPARTVHGIVTQFDQLDTSVDETRYRLLIEPRIADLARTVTSRLFQKQSVQEIITETLRHYGYREGVDFKFNLRAQYKRHEYITQYHETTFAFIQRIAADEGIWFRFEQAKNHEVIVFGDDLDAYARNQRIVPFRRHAGLANAGAESVRSIERRMRRVPEAIQLNDYNHRQADVSLLVEQNAARDDKTTNAVDSRWGEHYETPQEGRRIAQLRHEAHLAQRITFEGQGNVFALEAGEVLNLDQQLSDAPHGLFIVAVSSSGGRKQAYSNTFTAIPSDRVWRTPVIPAARPVINGVLPARVTSPGDYKRAYLTEEGWYVIRLPFDLDTWSPGGTSRPVRLAKPYSGDNYGHHFPLIDGAEVAIIHTDGDPDRPVIIGAMHDSLHPDLVNNLNHTRNLIRTAAQNEMRMEDKEGNEHVHLSTPYQTSELNLGHMVDGDGKERGQRAELTTGGHVAMRGVKGVLITADSPDAAGKQLDMEPGAALLEQALQQMRALADAAKAAEAVVADCAQQKALFDDTLKDLKKAGILVSAPAGVGIVSGEHLQLSADQNLIATAGGNADIGVMKRFTVAAGELVSIFAKKHGIKLFGAKGKVEIQAQSDEMALAALKDLSITSLDGKLVLTAAKEVWIGAGGSYIRISAHSIESGTPGDILEKCAYWGKRGPQTQSLAANSWAGTAFNDWFRVQLPNGEIARNRKYILTRADGGEIHGTTDNDGRVGLQQGVNVEGLSIRFPAVDGGGSAS